MTLARAAAPGRALVVGVLGVLALAACASPRVAPRAPARLPAEARLVDPGGQTFAAAARYRGHVVLLDFWAGWCDECKRTTPQVARLAAAFAADGLIVVGVDAGDAPADAAAYARAFHISYPIALDPDLALSDRLGASELPMLVVLDRDGRIAHRARRVDAPLLAALRGLLRAPAAAAGPARAATP